MARKVETQELVIPHLKLENDNPPVEVGGQLLQHSTNSTGGYERSRPPSFNPTRSANATCGIDPNGADGIVSDGSGNQYTMKNRGPIHCWTDSNLRTTVYNNGDVIYHPAWDDWGEYGTTDGALGVYPSCTDGVFCACEVAMSVGPGDCDLDTDCSDTYGYLYNWYAVVDDRGICPEGWHVPNDWEWNALEYDFDTRMPWGQNPELCANFIHWDPFPSVSNCSNVAGDSCAWIYDCDQILDWWGEGGDNDFQIPLSDIGTGCCETDWNCAPFNAFCCDEILQMIYEIDMAGGHCPDHQYDGDCAGGVPGITPCGDAQQWICMEFNVHCSAGNEYDTECTQAGDSCGTEPEDLCVIVDSCVELENRGYWCDDCHCHPHDEGDCTSIYYNQYCPPCTHCTGDGSPTGDVTEGWTHDIGWRGADGIGAFFAGTAHLWGNYYQPDIIPPDTVTHPLFGASGWDLIPGGARASTIELVTPNLGNCGIDGGLHGYCPEDPDTHPSPYEDFDYSYQCNPNGIGEVEFNQPCGEFGTNTCVANWPYTYVWESTQSQYWTSSSANEYFGVDEKWALIRSIPLGDNYMCNERNNSIEHPECTCMGRWLKGKWRGESVRCVTDMFSIDSGRFGAHCPGESWDNATCYQAMVVEGLAGGVECGNGASTCEYLYELSFIEDTGWNEFELKTVKYAGRFSQNWIDYPTDNISNLTWDVEVNTNQSHVSAQMNGDTLLVKNETESWNGTFNVTITVNGKDNANGVWIEDSQSIDIHVTSYPDGPACQPGYFEDSILEDAATPTGLDLVNGPECVPGSNWDDIDFIRIINIDALTEQGAELTDTDGNILINDSIIDLAGYIGSTYCVDVINNWQLRSLPNNPVDHTIANLYPGAVPGSFYTFPGDDGMYEQIGSAEVGQGFWVVYDEPGGWTGEECITGDLVENLTISLSEGWNLIAGPSYAAYLSQINDPGNIFVPGSLYEFTGTYTPADPSGTLMPGRGYWARAYDDGEITFYGDLSSAIRSYVNFTPGFNFSGNTSFMYEVCAGDPAGTYDCSNWINATIPVTPVMDAPTIWQIITDSDLEYESYDSAPSFALNGFELSENTEGVIHFQALVDEVGFPGAHTELEWSVSGLTTNYDATFQWGGHSNHGDDVWLKIIPNKNYNTYDFTDSANPEEVPDSVIVTATMPALYDSVSLTVTFDVSVSYISSVPEAFYLEVYAAIEPDGGHGYPLCNYDSSPTEEECTWYEPIIFHHNGIDDQTYAEWQATPTVGCGDETFPTTPVEATYDSCIYDPDPYENNPWFNAEYPSLANATSTYLAIQVMTMDNSQGHSEYCDNTTYALWYAGAGDSLEDADPVASAEVYPSTGSHVPYFFDGSDDLRIYYKCNDPWLYADLPYQFVYTFSYRVIECMAWDGGWGTYGGNKYCAYSPSFDWDCDESDLDCSEVNWVTVIVYRLIDGYSNFDWEYLGFGRSATIRFIDTSVPSPGETINSWYWTFGDGGTSTSQNPEHVYDLGGQYNISLTTSDTGGADHTHLTRVQAIEI